VAVRTSRALERPTRLTARPGDGACPGCGAVLPDHDGPMHVYLGASAACWDLYQRLARPSSAEAKATRSGRLVQDAYAAQHPGVPQRRSVQSVAVHLMDLCLLLERDGRIRRPVPVLGRMPPRRALDLHWLEPPVVRGTMTVADALWPDAGERRAECVDAWAREVWAAWAPHHATVRRWLDALPAQRADGGADGGM
jgi:Family of unknown function (DUF5946)